MWPPWSWFYQKAFFDLSGDHPATFSGQLGPLPFHSVALYATCYGLEGEDFAFFHFVMARLDEVYLKVANTPRGGGRNDNS